MDFPVYLRVGSASLHPHWVFETAAWTIAFWLYSRQRRLGGDVIDGRTRRWVIVAAAMGGLVGSRLLYLLEDPGRTAANWSSVSFVFDGKTIVGGLIGGLVGVEWMKGRLGVETATGDLLTLPLITGIAVGRVGCFLSGLDDRSYGIARWPRISTEPTRPPGERDTCLASLLFETAGSSVVKLRHPSIPRITLLSSGAAGENH